MEAPLRQSISSVSEKIQEIVDAAERVARDVQAEAEADAARYRVDRQREADALARERATRLNELSTSLSEHADRVRAEVISLSAELSRAADELRGHPNEAKPAATESISDSDHVADRVSHRGPVGLSLGGGTSGPAAYPGTGRTGATDGADVAVPEEALLRATQMSISGNSREEIESALRDEFGLDDPAAVTNHILGQVKAS